MFSNLINSFIPRQHGATVQSLGHPAAGIIGWVGTDDNASGEIVTEDSALKYAAFWCGVRVISEILASLPCILYQRISDTKKVRATKDARYSLVHDAPNEELDAYHFFEVGTAHQVIWGNSFSKIVRDGFNDPQSLELRLPDRTRIKRRDDGVLIYECSNPREIIEDPEMLRGTGFSFDGIVGYSLIKYAANSLGIAVAGDKYTGSTLKNGGVPSGVLDHPQRLGKEAREEYRREWDSIHGGSTKTGRLAITHGGIKYTPISMNNEDAQLIDQRKFSVVEIARWLRLPLYILADLENSGVRANIEQQSIDLVQYSLMPWVKRWEGALKNKLLTRPERQTMYFEFLLDSLLRGDTESRYDAYAVAKQWGWLSTNDIRAKENMDSIGEDGDVYLEPLNMKPAGSESDAETQAQLPQSIVEEYQKAVTSTVRETVETAKQMKSAMEAGFTKVDEAFVEYGKVLEQTVSSERETFGLIKKDIEELGTKVAVSVRVPELPDGREQRVMGIAKRMLEQSILVLLRVESAEAIKAARAQIRDKSKNFIQRVEKFYEGHRERTVSTFQVHADCHTEQLSDEHISVSKRSLIDCCDGNPEEFESRVTACVDKWMTERVTTEAKEFHERIYGTKDV